MPLRINTEAPDFKADSTQGPISFHDWIGDGWAVLFSHPKDFTPVCTTELGTMAGLKPEFDKGNTKIIGLSVDPVDDHKRWQQDIQEVTGNAVTYPMIGDPRLEVAKLYDMLPESAEVSTPANWKRGDDVIIAGSVSDEDAKKQYPEGWKTPKPYTRVVPQPK